MKTERLYTVVWERRYDPGEIQVCKGLSPRVALARLRVAVKLSGPITVHAITAEKNDEIQNRNR